MIQLIQAMIIALGLFWWLFVPLMILIGSRDWKIEAVSQCDIDDGRAMNRERMWVDVEIIVLVLLVGIAPPVLAFWLTL